MYYADPTSEGNQSNSLLPLVPIPVALLLCWDTKQLHKSWAKKTPQNKTNKYFSQSSSHSHTSIYEVFAKASFIYKAINKCIKTSKPHLCKISCSFWVRSV